MWITRNSRGTMWKMTQSTSGIGALLHRVGNGMVSGDNKRLVAGAVATERAACMRRLSACQLLSCVAGGCVAVIGALALFGWWFDVPFLTRVYLEWVSMKANTAMALVASGVALALLSRETDSDWSRLWGCGLALIVASVGGLTLAEYLWGWELGIDQWLLTMPPDPAVIAPVGRMAVSTAASFLLVGIGLCLLDVGWRLVVRPAQLCACVVWLVAFVGFLGYAYGVKSMSYLPEYATMAAHTTVAFMLLGFGMLCARPDRGVMAMVTEEAVGGEMMRRLLPATIGLMAGIGWLHVRGLQRGRYGVELALVGLVAVSVVVIAVLMWRQGRHLSEADVVRQWSVSALRMAKEEAERLIDSSFNAIFAVDLARRITRFNAAAERVFGYASAEVLGRVIDDLWASPSQGAQLLGRAVQERQCAEELVARRKDGAERHVMVCASVLCDAQGRAVGMVGIAQDITERKQSEQRLQEEKMQLEVLNKTMIGRELRMVEMKQEVNALLAELGRSKRYG